MNKVPDRVLLCMNAIEKFGPSARLIFKTEPQPTLGECNLDIAVVDTVFAADVVLDWLLANQGRVPGVTADDVTWSYPSLWPMYSESTLLRVLAKLRQWMEAV